MELKPGYKQTEIGVVPDDWNLKNLSDLVTFLDGKRKPVKDVDRAKMRGSIPYYGASGIVDYVNDYLFDEDLILLGEDGENILSRNCRLAFRISGKAWVNNHAHVLRPNSDIDIIFLTEYLESLNYEKFNSGTAQPKLNKQTCSRILITLPPTKEEQQAIATALSDVDALIDSLDRLITKKRDIKQAAMQELLTTKRRLPGFSGEWVEKQLGKTAILKARIGWQGLTTNEYLDSGDYYLVTGTEFKGGYIDWNQCHYVTKPRYEQDKNIQLKEHDVLVTKDGTIGKVALVDYLQKPATLNSGVFVIRPNGDAFHPEFFYYLLCSNIFSDFLSQLSAGSTINHLYQKDFVNFIYRTPPTLEEQRTIATVLSDMDSEITALEKKRDKTKLLKQGMMQELLTGRIRLI
ncbi:restriction endonuclease subunit S [Methanolobus sp. WCC5]|uniref:restriction endonuclease subunit S n=1 Tax=Methanolobus sp. WCC5 TaxID=3125785 RepID=UPI003253F835